MNEKQRRELGAYALRKLVREGKADAKFQREAARRARKVMKSTSKGGK